jgi:peptide subunit release factor 1 (eRF1)
MANTGPALDTLLGKHLERLATYEPRDVPVISLYLNLAPDQHGRERYDAFLRKAFAERLKAFDPHSAEHASLERDVERITAYLSDEIDPSRNAVAIFSSAGAGEFFEAIQLDVPIDDHWLFIGAVPHIYPLVRLVDQYPRYASVLVDTHRARILVFGLGTVERRAEVVGVKTRRSSMGGWSQARYQRRADHLHQQHIKEVVDALETIVRRDNIQHVIVAGDDVVVSLLRDAMPKALAERLVDVLKLDRTAGDDAIVDATLDVLRAKDAETDVERVREVVDAWQSGGLGVVGPEATLRALELGQVDELLIAGEPQAIKPIAARPGPAVPEPIAVESSSAVESDTRQIQLSDELVTRAQQTAADVRIIENAELLKAYGGVAASLRFRI